MSLIPFRDLKYLKLLLRMQTKPSPRESHTMKQMLNNEIKFQPNNPFLLHPFPPIAEEHIPITILLITKQMDEISVRSMNLNALENFVSANMDALKRVLVKEQFHCQLFCMSFVRFLQEYAKTKQLTHHLDKMKLTSFLDLFAAVLQIKNQQKILKANTAKDKGFNAYIHVILNALLFIASAKYIKENDEREMREERYLQRAIKVACLLMQNCEQEEEFQVVRQYLSIVSHLLIFNGMNGRPNKMLNFCLQNDQGLYYQVTTEITVPAGMIDKYTRSLYQYSFLDPQYRLNLLKSIKNLLSLNVSNTILCSHFQVLLGLIRSNVFNGVGLKKQVFDGLIQSQSRRNMAAIDELFMRIISFGLDMRDDQIQSYTLILAQSGQKKRKQQFALLYYHIYRQSKRLNPQVINFILEVYLQQNLPLEKFQLMLSKEANIIYSSNIKKLHSLVGENKQNSQLRQLLSILIEKRKDISFKTISKKSTHVFVSEDWLTALGNNPEVYKDYLSTIVQILCGKSLEIYPVLINLKSCIVKVSLQQYSKIQGEFWSRSLEFYSILLKSAEKFDVYDEVVFRYMILLQAIFGERLQSDTYSYFCIKFCKIAHPQTNFLTYLEYLVRMLKNKSSMLLYLQALLEFHFHLKLIFIEKKLYDISFLVNLVQEEYFCLSTYSFQSVIVLYELSLFVKQAQFQQDYFKIMQRWSNFMSRTECKQFQYLFSFREIKKVYPLMKQQQMKEPTDRIKMVWDTVLSLIGENRAKKQYIQMGGNKIIVNWKSEQEIAKRGIQISGIFLRNSNIQLYWDIRIQTRQKIYTIAINYDRAILEQQNKHIKQSKLVIKQINMKQLKKYAPESIDFDMKLQSHNKKMKISLKVYDIQIIDHDFEGNIMTIKLHCKENSYLKDIKIIESFMPGQTSSLDQHIVPLNRWQIKILKLSTLISQKFGTKFDFQHAFCCIGQMLSYFAFVNLPFAYDILIRLATKMISFHKGNVFGQMKVILQICDAIDKNFVSMKGRGKIITPIVEMQDSKYYPYPYYYLFVSALLPKNFWLSFNENTKKNLIKVLSQVIKVEQFRKIQNKRLLLFDQMLEITIQNESYFEICEQILDHHELDQILSKKFKKFMHLAHQSSYFKQLLTNYLYKKLQYLNIQQNEQYLDKRLRCKFLIVKSQKYEEQIFKLCKIQSKISLLYYHAQNLTFDSNGQPSGLYFIKKLIQLIDVSQTEQVIGWLIVQVKQLMFVNQMLKKDKKKINYEVNNVYFELLCINRSKANEQDKSNIDDLIYSMLQSLQTEFKSKPQIKIQLQSAFQTATFIQFLKEITQQIIQKYKNINVYGKNDKFVDIYTLATSIITQFQKKNFFQFMIKYRYYFSSDCKLLKALIQYQGFKELKLAHFSVFLQYIFEILLIIEQKSNFTLDQCKQLFTSINEYIEFIINTLDEKCMPKALFYNYPRLSGSKDGLHDTNKAIRRIKRVVQNIKFLQLRGGIYFKCVLIVIKLMKLNPLLNYNNLVQYFLFGPINSYNRDPQIFKAPTKMPDLVSNSSLNMRDRSAAQVYISDSAQTYKLYYNNEDYPRNPFNEQADLSVYIPDYFLMSIAEFLNEKGREIDADLLQRYSNSFLRGIANYKIGREMIIPSVNNYQISKYDDVVRILQGQQRPKQRSPPSSPVVNRYLRRAQSAAYEQLKPFTQKEIDPFSPPKKMGRKKTEDYSVEIMRRKIEVIDTIKMDPKNWSKSQAAKKIPSYFCDRAKDIRIIELMHTHFVMKNRLLQQNQPSNQNRQQKGVQFHMKQYAACLKQQKRQLSGDSNALLEQKIRKVKKIHPYTTEQPPVLNIASNCLSNMACPITLKITNNDYDIRRQNQSIYMKYYLQTPQPIEQTTFQKDEQFYNAGMQIEESILIEQVRDQQERIVQEKPYCQLVTRQGSYFCEFQLEKSLILRSKKDRSLFDNNLWYLKLGTPSDSLIKAQIKVQIRPEDVIQILYRRFNQTTNNSLQFFLKDGTSKFVTFYRRQNISAIIRQLQKIFKGIKMVKDLVKQFEQARFTDRWVEGYLSNFDYLMLVNKYSGRTYNDLGQYYVFPWVLKDYSSQKLDLTDHDSYRDLSKPIGALNPQKLKRYMSKYRSESSNPEKCIYGSHYSTSLFVFYYLVRLQPYSSLHRDMQKGRWDEADRLFSSIQQVWDSLYSESVTSDIKQCIPEFYYMPAFLRNIAHIQLGKKQCGSYVGDVQLPPWARTAEQFVMTMRAALESDYVSENLHLWIDLIFGKHQHSQERYNVFHPYSYSDPEILGKFSSRNTREIEGKICQITYFGQCPIQLFKRQHKTKKTIGDIRQARSTYLIRSENSIQPQIVGEGSIPSGWTITQVQLDGTSFIIWLKNASKQQKQAAIISAHSNTQSLRESLQNLQDIPKNEAKVSIEVKLTVNERHQLSIGKQFLMDLDIRFIFTRTEINQLWIACFGHKGIRIYNWQVEQHWAWEYGEVREVHLQATRLIFSVPNGKLYCYSFLDRKCQEIVVFKDRQICDMIMKVFPLAHLPNRDRNQINYKVLCIGDKQRVSIANVSFEQSTNFTSLGRPS